MFTGGVSKKTIGDEAESRALAWLQGQGLHLVQRNYRVAHGPRAAGGEIDLIMRDGAGTLLFIEVRARQNNRHGGAAASVSATKRTRLVRTAQHYLLRLSRPPPCRFDVVTIDGEQIDWLQAAFDAS